MNPALKFNRPHSVRDLFLIIKAPRTGKKFAAACALIFTLFLSSFTAAGDAHCAEKKGRAEKNAFVDIYKVYSYHPVMQYFDGETGLFLKPLNVKDKLAQKQIIEKRSLDYSSLYAQSSAGLFKIKSEMEHICGQAASVAKAIALLKAEPLKTAGGDIDKKATEKRIKELESEISGLRKQLDNLALIYKQSAEPLVAIHHLGRTESDKLIRTVIKETNDAIARVSEKLEIKNIFLKANKNPDGRAGNYGTAGIENIEAAWRYGPDYGLAQRLMSVKNPPAAESQAGPKHGQYIQNENFRRVRELLKARLDSKVTPDASALAGSPFINEGTDITNDVIIELLKENDISKSAMDKIIEYLSAGSEN